MTAKSLFCVFSAASLVAIAGGQSLPAAGESQPVGTPIAAKVIEVHGDVQHALVGGKDWKRCELNEEYPPQTKIRTGIRSSIKLQIGQEEPYTCMLIDSVGLTVISEALKTQDAKKVRVGVGYGRIQAGVAEGGLKSDFTVDSPVATLSKKGTWGISLSYERATDNFQVALADRGLVDVINQVTLESREVAPHELVTQAMINWLDQSAQLRNVAVPDVMGQENVQLVFNRLQQDGLGVVNPGNGQANMISLANPRANDAFADLTRAAMTTPPLTPPPNVAATIFRRPEGFFGSGRGDELIPLLIGSESTLAQRGWARPGTYTFRRSALEGWLQHRHK